MTFVGWFYGWIPIFIQHKINVNVFIIDLAKLVKKLVISRGMYNYFQLSEIFRWDVTG